jgi:hypothetical protein
VALEITISVLCASDFKAIASFSIECVQWYRIWADDISDPFFFQHPVANIIGYMISCLFGTVLDKPVSLWL